MAKLILKVPLVAQERKNTCWYAAACMVSYYFFQGPRLGVPEIWEKGDNTGISPHSFVKLAQNEHLIYCTDRRGAATTYNENVLFGLLRDFGPIWCAGYWFGFGHIIVLTGIDGEKLLFNDPDGGVAKTNSIKWFSEKVAHGVPGHLMRKNPNSS